MVTKERWRYAQEYERSFWKNAADQMAAGSAGQLDWYAWKASEMEKRLASHFGEKKENSIKVLEIGSGPIGIVSFLKWGERYTIDPLEDFYSSNAALSKLRDPAVNYGQGTGEKIPFQDNSFSLVILDNVLDHVHEASGVLKEIYRVLSGEGKLYLAVNIHTNWGGALHSLLSKLKIDKGHPYTFTEESIREFIRKNRFEVLSEAINDYYEARQKDRMSSSLKDKIKGYTGLSEFVYYAICSKGK